MNNRQSVYLLTFMMIFVSCQSADDSKTNSDIPGTTPKIEYRPLVIKTGVENGHPAGIRIAIATTKDSDSSTTYKLLSTYQDMPVGFLIVLPRETNGKHKIGSSFIKSLGPPSDLFLQVLGDQYGQKIDSSARMTDTIPFIAMNLNTLYDSGETKKDGDWIAAEYKLFFDTDSEDGDAELFMNIVPGQWIEFAEKDEDYRAHLIKLFTQKK